jgi:hypothetical protein
VARVIRVRVLVPDVVAVQIGRRMRLAVVIVPALAGQMVRRGEEQQQQAQRERGRGSVAAEDHAVSVTGESMRTQAMRHLRAR